MDAQWTLGVLIGLPLTVLVLIGSALLGLWLWKRWRESGSYIAEDYWMGAIGCLIVFVVVLLGGLVAYFPYEAQYHQWRTISGTVEKIDKRLIAEDKGMAERYVLMIDGQPYGVDDTRAATVEPGDQVSIKCRRDWQYASVPGWVCRWAQ